MFGPSARNLATQNEGKASLGFPPLRQCGGRWLVWGLDSDHLFDVHGEPTALGQSLQQYFRFRADFLNDAVRPLLMNVEQAAQLFAKQKRRLAPPVQSR